MATPTYVALQTITVSSNASDITFSNIPNTYRDLVLVAQCKSTASAYDQAIEFNGDASSSGNYDCRILWGNFSNASNSAGSSNLIDYYGSVSTDFTNVTVVHIAEYSANDKSTFWISRSNRQANGVDIITGKWAPTTVVTSIRYYLNGGGTIAIGSTVSLYGIEA